MKVLRTILLGTAIVCSAATAHAVTITENFVGVISGANTTDTTGLFGKPGADLAGKAITIHTQYVTTLFTNRGVCRTSPLCTYDYSENNPGTPGSVLTSVTVNGQRVVYAPAYEGVVFFQDNYQNRFSASTDVWSGWGLGFRGSDVSVAFKSAVAFGVPLSPGNGPVLNVNTDIVYFYQPSDQIPSETLTFSVTSATP